MAENKKTCAAAATCRLNKATTFSKDIALGTPKQPPGDPSRWENMNHYTQFMDTLINFMTQSFFFMSEVYTSKTGQPLTENAMANMPADILNDNQRLTKAQEICERIELRISEVKELERLLGALGTQIPSPASGQIVAYEPLQSAEINAMSEEQRMTKAKEIVTKIEGKIKEVNELDRMLDQLGNPIPSPSRTQGFGSLPQSSESMTPEQRMSKAKEIVTNIETKMKEVSDIECCLTAMGVPSPRGASPQYKSGNTGAAIVMCTDRPVCIDGPMSGDQDSAKIQELISKIEKGMKEIAELEKMLEQLGSPIPCPSKTKTKATRSKRATSSQGQQQKRVSSGGRPQYPVYSGVAARGQSSDCDPSCDNSTAQRGGARAMQPGVFTEAQISPSSYPKPRRPVNNISAVKKRLQFDNTPAKARGSGGGRMRYAGYESPDYLNMGFRVDQPTRGSPNYLNMGFRIDQPSYGTPDYLNMGFTEEQSSFGNASRNATYNSSYSNGSGSATSSRGGYSDLDDCECYVSSANPSKSSIMGQLSTNSSGSTNTRMRAYQQAASAGYQQQGYQEPLNYANYPKRTAAPPPVRNAQARARRPMPAPVAQRRVQQRKAPASSNANEYCEC